MLGVVQFRAELYGEHISKLLALHGGGNREMPLIRGDCVSEPARSALARQKPKVAFPESRTPEAALAGLYLYFGCWEEAHAFTDAAESPENYFWHAIIHRQEPDAANSAYWFRKTGKHPVFAELADEAERHGFDTTRPWNPMTFVEYCSRAAAGSPDAAIARRVQLSEWQLLFDYCARGLNR